jgi:hypothetical protein
LPDYRYLSVIYGLKLDGRAFSVSGATPVFDGWKAAFGGTKKQDATEENDASDDESEGERTLPDIPEGTQMQAQGITVAAKKTKPPSHYTEGTLVDDMENVAKHVSDPAKRARLKETSGIGTQATRASIIETLQIRGFVKTKGKKLLATAEGTALIERLERVAPELADPGETAVWEDRLEAIASGESSPVEFVRDVGANVVRHIEAFRASAAPSTLFSSSSASATPTAPGVNTGIDGIMDRGAWFEHPKVKGRLYKEQWGHSFTTDEIARLVRGDTLIVNDCKSKAGVSLPPKAVRYNAKAKPWPALEFSDAGDSGTEAAEGGGNGGGASLAPKPKPPVRTGPRGRLF